MATLAGAPLAPSWWQSLLAVVTAGLLLLAAALGRLAWLRDVALVSGLVACLIAAIPFLGLAPVAELRLQDTAWPEARGGARLYTPGTDAGIQAWLARGLGERSR